MCWYHLDQTLQWFQNKPATAGVPPAIWLQVASYSGHSNQLRPCSPSLVTAPFFSRVWCLNQTIFDISALSWPMTIKGTIQISQQMNMYQLHNTEAKAYHIFAHLCIILFHLRFGLILHYFNTQQIHLIPCRVQCAFTYFVPVATNNSALNKQIKQAGSGIEPFIFR